MELTFTDLVTGFWLGLGILGLRALVACTAPASTYVVPRRLVAA